MILSRWAFSDTFEHKLKLAITSWARFCVLYGSGQIRVTQAEVRSGIPFTALYCELFENLEDSGLIERVSIPFTSFR